MQLGRAALIYDGSCGFCRRWIERARRWDRYGLLELVPYQTADFATRFPTVSRDACTQRIHLVDVGGSVYQGAAAGREALRRLPGGWFWALPFRLPGALRIADRVYDWITHRWGPLPRRARRAPPAALGISGSATVRAARAGALTSILSVRYLGTKVRARLARRDRRQAIIDSYHLKSAEQVVELMGNMKGLMMKLGQIVSYVTDDVPEQYRTVLRQLQTSSPPMHFALARDVIEGELQAPLPQLFGDIDPEPLAAASIGQVHRARLRSGEDVVVKVQYPGVDAAIRADLTGMSLINGVLGMLNPGLDPKPLAEELRARIGEEIDYSREARNQQIFADLYDCHPFIHIPAVFPRYSTARVLTCERVCGHGFDWLLAQPEAYRQRIAEILFRFVFGSIFRLCIFNADPHPGNYLFHENGTVSFLDFGCVKFFRPEMVAEWRALVRAHLRGDKEAFRAQTVRLGFLPPDSELSLDLHYDFMAYFYEPVSRDAPFTFTPEYNAQSLGMAFDRSHPRWAEVQRHVNMPPDFALVNRLQWGLTAILAQLRATNNWRRIWNEYLFDQPPSTDLGRQSAAFRARWKAEHGIPAQATVWAERDGLRWGVPGGKPPAEWPGASAPVSEVQTHGVT